jgi:hypothetical protein
MSAWDGIAYQSNGDVTIRIPRRVLKEYGGNFTTANVLDIVNKNAAYGTYQIIEYYD